MDVEFHVRAGLPEGYKDQKQEKAVGNRVN
jgi:hypothetical protein